MTIISIDELIDYSQDLEIEDVNFHDNLLLSYSSDNIFDTRDISEDIEWKKSNNEEYSELDILLKFMEHKDIEECYISE